MTPGRSRAAPQGTLPRDGGAQGCGKDPCHPSLSALSASAGWCSAAGHGLPCSTSTASLPAPRHASATGALSNCYCATVGRVEGGESPLGAERQMGRAGLLLASDAEMRTAGCLLLGGRSSESIKSIAVAAPQLRQSSTEWLACSLSVAEASPSHLGFFHQLWCI